jgi:pimeloyl-ACP methyl ester carboxylesterase
MWWVDRTTQWTDLAREYGSYVTVNDASLKRQLWVQVFNADSTLATVYLIHGLGGRSEQWIEQIAVFRELGFKVVVPDLLGHARSPKPKAQLPYQFDLMVEDVKSLARKYSVEARQPTFFIGHSYGALICLDIARDHGLVEAVQCKGIALLGCTFDPINPPPILCCADCVLELLRPMVSKAAQKILYHESTSRDLVLREAKTTSQNPWHVMRGIARGRRDLTDGDLKSIELPVLILHGETDGLAKRDSSEKAAKKLKDAQWHLIKETSHNLMMEKPAVVSEHLSQWIEFHMKK